MQRPPRDGVCGETVRTSASRRRAAACGGRFLGCIRPLVAHGDESRRSPLLRRCQGCARACPCSAALHCPRACEGAVGWRRVVRIDSIGYNTARDGHKSTRARVQVVADRSWQGGDDAVGAALSGSGGLRWRGRDGESTSIGVRRGCRLCCAGRGCCDRRAVCGRARRPFPSS